MIHVLRRRNFALLWSAGLISMTGDWVLYTALPIYVYTLTKSSLATSLMFVAELLPSLLLSSVAGVFVDRWPRKRIMLIANILLGLTLLPLLLVRSAEWVPLVYVVGFVQSTIARFFNPAEAAVLPTLVPEEMLVTANSLSSLNSSTARLVGPAIGGLLTASTGLVGVTIADAASFAIAAILIAFLTLPSRERAMASAEETPERAFTGVWRQWIEGLQLVRRNATLSLITAIFALTAVGEGVFGPIFVIWVKTVLHGTALHFGWFMSAQAVGGIAGGLIIGGLGSRLQPRRTVASAMLLFALLDMALFSYPVLTRAVPPGLAIMVLVGVPAAAAGSSALALLQMASPDEYRGRIFGALGTTGALASLAGTLLAGVLGGFLSPILLLNVFQGGSYIVAALAFFFFLGPRLPAERQAEAPGEPVHEM